MEAATSQGIQDRTSAIFQTPTRDRLSEVEERIKKVAEYIARKDIEQEEWKTRIENFLLNRTLGPEEAGKLLKLTTDGVRKSIMAGNLGGGKEGGRWKTSYKDIIAYMQNRPKKFGQNISLMDVVKVI